MRKEFFPGFFLWILIFTAFHSRTQAQLLCRGSLGDPVVDITFGSGSNPGPPLGAGITNYTYVTSTCPVDGDYTLTSTTSNCFGNSWHSVTTDHTGNPNGYFMLVNASLQPNDFYVTTIHGLCPSTTFEFAAWVLNILQSSACGGTGILPNLTFKIETTSHQLLDSFNTGDIPTTAGATWKKYGFIFQTPPGISDVVVRMTNNAPGGCGNDLALDDITFRPCGPMVNTMIGNSGNASMNLCQGDTSSLMFSATVSAGYQAPAFQWQLSLDNGLSWTDYPGATDSVFIRKATSPGIYKYRLTVAEAGNIGSLLCRVASNVITITVSRLPSVSAQNDGPKCEGSALTLSANGGSRYQWTGPGNFSDTVKNPLIQPVGLSAGGGYQVIVTDSLGCRSVDSTTVVINSKPVAHFISSTPVCEGSPVNFTDQSVSAAQKIVKWYWDFGDGSVSTAQNPANRFAGGGVYPVRLLVQTDSACSSDTLVSQFLVHDLPVPGFILPKVCLSDPFALFIDSSAIADHTENRFSYLWNFGDPNANAARPDTSTMKNPSHRYTAVGNYQVSLSVRSGDGCMQDLVKNFTVNGSLPKAGFTLEGPNPLCSNLPVTLADSSSVDFGSITRTEIYWSYPSDTSWKTTDSNFLAGNQYTFQYPDTGGINPVTYSIRYVVYSGISCVNETSRNLIIYPAPKVVFDSLAGVCSGLPRFTITAARELTGISGGGSYSGPGMLPGGNFFDPATAPVGTDTIRYTYLTTMGCKDSTAQTIQVYPKPHVSAGPDTTILEGGSAILNGMATGNIRSYLWTPQTAILNNGTPNPTVFPKNTTLYSLTVTTTDNCINSDQVLIKVLKTPLIPNAFSPNGDGINDYWIIQYIQSYPGVEVSIFNRYGLKVFSSHGYSTPWDGKYNGTPLPVGTYYYIIDRKINAPLLSGSVTILR